MTYPPRLPHLVTDAVLVAKLSPSYQHAHRVDAEEAQQCLTTALRTPLREALLDACWSGLLAKSPRFKEETILEKLAEGLGTRPLRPGRIRESDARWSAFWIEVDLAAGTASEAARSALETEAGQAMAKSGIQEVGRFLAEELGRH